MITVNFASKDYTQGDHTLTQLQLINKYLILFKGSNFFNVTWQIVPTFTNIRTT